MIVYLDSSALVKLFVRESASDLVQQRCDAADAVVTSRVAFAEACAAFARRRAERRLGAAEVRALRQALADAWRRLAVVEVNEVAAGDLALKHTLRGFDAVHLAAALEVSAHAGGVPLSFCSFDDRQLPAARAEGLEVVSTGATAAKPRTPG